MITEQITSFLSALATEIPNFEPEPITKSATEVLSNSEICKEQKIRCICGVDMKLQGKELIQCTKCGYYLHKSCLSLSDNNFKQFLCPICVFQIDGSDPLSYLTCMTERFNDSIKDLSNLFKKGEEIANELPYKLERLQTSKDLNYFVECFKTFESSINELKEGYQSAFEKFNNIDVPPPPPQQPSSSNF